MKRLALPLAAAMILASTALPSSAEVFITQQQALKSAFGTSAVEREAFFLTDAQAKAVQQACGSKTHAGLVIRYVARSQGAITGYAYFDAHRVRTLPETVMFLVTPHGRVSRIEILSFSEPVDYLPKKRWLDQFRGRRLDSSLSLTGAIRPISGASLSGRAIVQASRRILAIHQVLPAEKPASSRAAASPR